jgi:hypothetical protein
MSNNDNEDKVSEDEYLIIASIGSNILTIFAQLKDSLLTLMRMIILPMLLLLQA